MNFYKQIKQRQNDYYSLIKSNRRNIEMYCKKSIIEWDEKERYNREKRLRKHESILSEKIELLDELMRLNFN
jgi:hypothetical protein